MTALITATDQPLQRAIESMALDLYYCDTVKPDSEGFRTDIDEMCYRIARKVTETFHDRLESTIMDMIDFERERMGYSLEGED